MVDDFDMKENPEEFEDRWADVEYENDNEAGWIEFDPGQFIWDEMAANP